MSDKIQAMTGGCRCDRVRFAITVPPMLTMICHCTGCQRMTGSAFSYSVAVPNAGFALTQGETVIGGLHGDFARHHHCDWCKSWIYTELPAEMGFTNVRASMLDEPIDDLPFMETYTSEMLPWAKTPARHSFANFPAHERMPALLAEFAAR